ncbi:hypothetical protein BASA81_013480 [Batrachochytrium salamandrivorans]|nr:hypothetical protein BASA81_013480 [Batrachochytrium salamandrivorans]
MLSANVFAIEHPNDAHSGSLLARRAVMADADDVFLQKRSDDKDQEEQTKPKTYIPIPNSGQKGYVYREDLSENDFDSDSSSSDGAEGSSTDFPDYDPEQDDEDQGARNNVYSGLDSGQRRPSFADALGGSPSQVFDHIKNGLSRAKQGAKLFASRQRALDASDKVRLHFGGIEAEPTYVMFRLESIMETVDNFYKVVLDAEPKYCRLAELLGMSDTKRLEDLEAHIKAVGAYKNNISEHFDKIKKMCTRQYQSTLCHNTTGIRLRFLGRALDPGVENVYTWLRGGVLNGEADLDQQWLDGTVEHESMGTRHDNRALAARLADFLQVAYRQYQSTLWKYHRDRLVEVG